MFDVDDEVMFNHDGKIHRGKIRITNSRKMYAIVKVDGQDGDYYCHWNTLTKVQTHSSTRCKVETKYQRAYHKKPTPQPSNHRTAVAPKCTCEKRKVNNFGCDCEGGKLELAQERAKKGA